MQRFPFAFAPAYRIAARPFGVSPRTAWVEVSDEQVDAHFGRWRVTTPLENLGDVVITGPYRYAKTAGPARLGITDRGLTFATNGQEGVLMKFLTPVRGIEPTGLIRHPELTVTVRAPSDLVGALARRR